MNDNEAARIAAAIHELRPDWPVASLRTLLARPELVNKSRRDVAVALAWVACESDTTTPARVIESGPWWRAANIETPDRIIRRPPMKSEECATHAGEWRDFCRCCAADRRAAADLEANGPRLTRDDAIAAARAGIEAARTQAIADKPTTRPAPDRIRASLRDEREVGA